MHQLIIIVFWNDRGSFFFTKLFILVTAEIIEEAQNEVLGCFNRSIGGSIVINPTAITITAITVKCKSSIVKIFIRMPTLSSVAVNKSRSLLSLDTVIKVV